MNKISLVPSQAMWHKIEGFPYPEKYCPYCERLLVTNNALHIMGQEEHFKAILICLNPKCPVYDEDARDAYVRIYYSSDFAFKVMEKQFGNDPRKVAGFLENK